MIIAHQYGGGIFNQLTSFEISYGLSNVLNDFVLVHGLDKTIAGRESHIDYKLPSFVNNNYNIKLLDVIDFSNNKNLILKNETIKELLNKNGYNNSYTMHYFNLNKNNKQYEKDFADNKKEIVDKKDYIFSGPNLVYYSSFFFNIDKNFDNIMSSIKFKQEYYDFAKEIVNVVGKFNGCHVRRTDHVKVVDIDEYKFKSGIERFNNNLPILVSTDEYYNPMFKTNNIILIEDVIENYLKKEFMQLNDSSDIAFAIISNLVMRYSEDFIGTGTSTYTGHIQRDLYKNKNIDFKFFNEDFAPKIDIGKTKYSWQQVDVQTEYRAVLREWPECKVLS